VYLQGFRNGGVRNSMRFCCVVTTITPPTLSIRILTDRLSLIGARLVIVGDRKGPERYELEYAAVDFLPLSKQQAGPFELGRLLPTDHYARKNVGYLHAIAAGVPLIYETDDDNAPSATWSLRQEEVADIRVVPSPTPGQPSWVNVYRYFSSENIWPRGLPLDSVSLPAPEPEFSGKGVRSPIQQGLVDKAPDVDAIWRLTQDRIFRFDLAPSICLQPGNWCPFNTQSTWWWPDAYPLLYIPSHCSFRMCDIWKSFVAQRCLWEMGYGVVFHAAEAVQERNVHNLMRDFEDEVPGYLGNRRLAEVLTRLALAPGKENAADNLVRCYEALQTAGFFPMDELTLVRAWITDFEGLHR
jgi:hypothetical protein